jgi:DNA-binding NtrC family response regulator
MSIHNVVPSPSQSSVELRTPEYRELGSQPFVCASPLTRKLSLQAEMIAPHLRLAVIEGEPGAGKQTFARLLYDRAAAASASLRRAGFKRCDAREWLLAESHAQPIPHFTYLDRVDLLGVPGQALLLRVLKNYDAAPASAPVLVASSESPLRELAEKGEFLAELAYRLTAIRLAVPPLRQRREDIVPLATLFLDRLRLRYQVPGFSLTAGAIMRLHEHDWPGNVRELSSVIESAVLECTDRIIREEDLSLRPVAGHLEGPQKTPPTLNLDAVVQKHLRYVLELNRGNKLRTARQLGISRSTLYRMLDTGRSFPP